MAIAISHHDNDWVNNVHNPLFVRRPHKQPCQQPCRGGSGSDSDPAVSPTSGSPSPTSMSSLIKKLRRNPSDTVCRIMEATCNTMSNIRHMCKTDYEFVVACATMVIFTRTCDMKFVSIDRAHQLADEAIEYYRNATAFLDDNDVVTSAVCAAYNDTVMHRCKRRSDPMDSIDSYDHFLSWLMVTGNISRLVRRVGKQDELHRMASHLVTKFLNSGAPQWHPVIEDLDM